MSGIRRKVMGAALAVFVGIVPAACDDFLEVQNPNNLEAEAVDPERDAVLLSFSAYQAFVSRYGNILVYAAWFSGEAWVGDTFPTRNDFGRREIPIDGNGDRNGIWNGIHSSLQFAEETARSIGPAGNTLALARAHFTAAMAVRIQAEYFCEGTIAESWTVARGPVSSQALLDSAIVRFERTIAVATAVGGADATALITASRVGIARAHLQAGRAAQASAAAAQVPADFEFVFHMMDDASNRSLGNTVWSFSESRISLVTPPAYRAMADEGDPRISYTDMGRNAQDAVLRFFRQGKYPGWGASYRVASGLEARYIKIEADANPGEMLAFINERRAVGNQDPMPATSNMDALLMELMAQKSRDFWLEGQRMADFRRNPNHVPNIIQPGQQTYYKPELGPVRDQMCWPVGGDEMRNNPFWPDP